MILSLKSKVHNHKIFNLINSSIDLRESIKQQEDIIQNLQLIVKEHLKNADLMRDKEIKVNLEKLKYERQVLTEKHKQVNCEYPIEINEFYQAETCP